MSEEEELDKKERELLTSRSRYSENSLPYADFTADLNRLQQRREDLKGNREGKDKWKMFYYSQIIPLIALSISIIALVKTCGK